MSLAAAYSSPIDDFRNIQAIAMRRPANGDDLAQGLQQIYQSILNVDLDRYDHAEVRASAPSLMQAMFELRLGLCGQIPEWRRAGMMTPAVQKGLRDVLRVSRYGGDVLGEFYMNFDRSRGGRRAFTGGNRKTHVNPAFYDGHDLGFRSGDIIVMRGTAHNSAAIARIGDVDSQFSHIGIVHIDEEGKHWFVESLIEVGAVVAQLEYVLDHGVARAVLYRYRDAELAKKASGYIFKRVSKSRGRWQRSIPYDFTFELEGYKTLFCSKLVREAYDVASGGSIKLPTFGTRLDMSNQDFFERVGATASQTFAPGDVDLEPEFELIAEWQDYRQTGSLRLQDLIMDKIFEWMARDGWHFEETALVRIVSLFGRAASYLSEDAKELLKDVFPRVPVNMKRETVAVVAMLHKTGEELHAVLQALDEDAIRMYGRPVQPREIFDHLEALRAQSGGRIGYLVAPQAPAL